MVMPEPYHRSDEGRPVKATAAHLRNMSFSLDVCSTRIDYSRPAVLELLQRSGYSWERTQSLARRCAIESCKLLPIDSQGTCANITRVRSKAAGFWLRGVEISNATFRPSAMQPCQQRETPVVVSMSAGEYHSLLLPVIENFLKMSASTTVMAVHLDSAVGHTREELAHLSSLGGGCRVLLNPIRLRNTYRLENGYLLQANLLNALMAQLMLREPAGGESVLVLQQSNMMWFRPCWEQYIQRTRCPEPWWFGFYESKLVGGARSGDGEYRTLSDTHPCLTHFLAHTEPKPSCASQVCAPRLSGTLHSQRR